MIVEACVDKIMALGDNESLRQGFRDIFIAVSNDAETQDLPSATLVVPLYDEACNLQPGDWAPEIHLVIRKIDHVEAEDADSSSGDQVEHETTEESEA